MSARLGPKAVCEAKLKFNTYVDAHKYILKNGLINRAPYLCRILDDFGHNHHHITANPGDVETYREWRINRKRNSRRNPDTKRESKRRTRRRAALRKVADRLNNEMTHDDIMREIELGY